MSDEKDEAQAKLAAFDFKLGVWEHYKGGLYVVFAISLDEETLQRLVHYFSIEKKTRWTRSLLNFTQYVGPGEFSPRRFVYDRDATLVEMMEAFDIPRAI
jgi:hypothetical protein